MKNFKEFMVNENQNASIMKRLIERIKERPKIDDEGNNWFYIRFEKDKPYYYFQDSEKDEFYELSYKQFAKLYSEYRKLDGIQHPDIELFI